MTRSHVLLHCPNETARERGKGRPRGCSGFVSVGTAKMDEWVVWDAVERTAPRGEG
jgi:hypothetical protein